jgi:hypothetical protein
MTRIFIYLNDQIKGFQEEQKIYWRQFKNTGRLADFGHGQCYSQTLSSDACATLNAKAREN